MKVRVARIFNKCRIFNTLYGRLALSVFACITAIIIIGGFLFLRGLQLHQREVAQTLHQDLADYVVKSALTYSDKGLDLKASEKLFHDLMILGPSLEFYLLDPGGEILAYSTDPNNIKREKIDLNPIQKFFNPQLSAYPLLGQDPKALNRENVFSAAPIYSNKKLLGYLYVILSGTQYEGVADMVLSSKMIRWSVWLFVGGGLISLLIALFLTGWVTRPLRDLTAQVKGYKLGDIDHENNGSVEFGKRWKNSSGNEIHILGEAFSKLLNKLEQQHKNVLTMDHSRRELIAHVSHDLRTPLASLQGYLETWELNKSTLTAEESERYIGIAKSNAHTLAKLIEQLFELAQLESNKESLAVENLSMAELVQDVLQKFELQAKQKQVSLEVHPKDSTFQVMGDVEKLDRVITNLVENALRHTEAGGCIRVNLAREGKSVSVKVSDTGVGIPDEDIQKIFEPHFKAGNTVRDNTAHGGLGLTITRKLLALHRTDISVRRLEDAGACFEFRLPAQ